MIAKLFNFRSPLSRCSGWTIAFVAASALPLCSQTVPRPLAAYDLELTNYYRLPPNNAVTRLTAKLQRGETKLVWEEHSGYLKSILKELELPISSQLLVFSKTSLQKQQISAKNPRAIFFNDKAYVAWIPGAPLIEILAFDPALGGVFYTVEQTQTSKVLPERNNRCLECHLAPRTLDVPGPQARSFSTSAGGEIDLLSGASQVDHRTPMEDRWGGWFVTGAYGNLLHRGNRFSKVEGATHLSGENVAVTTADISHDCDISLYPARSSDIVALMVFEHQTQMQNLLTRLRYESEAALRQSGSVQSLREVSETFLKYLLFVDEAPISGAIEGNRDFTELFQTAALKDKKGRSLREFDLRRRLFKFPCSYLIYSEAFDGLPAAMRQHLYHRLWSILTGADKSSDYAKISPESKRAILDILTETKTNLPAYWTL